MRILCPLFFFCGSWRVVIRMCLGLWACLEYYAYSGNYLVDWYGAMYSLAKLALFQALGRETSREGYPVTSKWYTFARKSRWGGFAGSYYFSSCHEEPWQGHPARYRRCKSSCQDARYYGSAVYRRRKVGILGNGFVTK